MPNTDYQKRYTSVPVDISKKTEYIILKLLNREIKEIKLVRTQSGILIIEGRGTHLHID